MGLVGCGAGFAAGAGFGAGAGDLAGCLGAVAGVRDWVGGPADLAAGTDGLTNALGLADCGDELVGDAGLAAGADGLTAGAGGFADNRGLGGGVDICGVAGCDRGFSNRR